MRKISFVMLQLVLSILLIVFGVLIEFNGKNSASGVPVLLFTVPGITILAACILDGFKFKKALIFPSIVLLLAILLDVGVVLIYKVRLSNYLYFCLFLLVDIIACVICELFHLVVVNKK